MEKPGLGARSATGGEGGDGLAEGPRRASQPAGARRSVHAGDAAAAAAVDQKPAIRGAVAAIAAFVAIGLVAQRQL